MVGRDAELRRGPHRDDPRHPDASSVWIAVIVPWATLERAKTA
jgi:hypothetical protein